MTSTPLPRTLRGGIPTGYTASYATTVVGTADQLANLITNHRTAGTLIAVGRPLALPHRPGHYQIRMRLRITIAQRPAITAPPGPPRRIRPRRTRRTAIGTVLACVAVGVLATIAYLLGMLAELIATHLHELLTVGVIAGLLTAAVSVRRRKHCPGC
jgi:hypothetical protein